MTGTTTTADRERELLARLGLSPASSPEDIETAYRDIVGYLARAPRDLKPWARWEAEAAGRAYALLIDPATPADPDALGGPDATAVLPGGPATPPARRDASSRRRRAVVEVARDEPDDPDDPDELDEPDDVADDEADVDALIASVTPGAHPDIVGRPARRVAKAVAKASRPVARPAARSRSRGHPVARRVLLGGLVLGAIFAVAVIGYGAGAPAAPPVGGDQPAASDAAIDEAQVAALMARIQADPKDTEALMGLGDAFYAAGDFATAATWLNKVLAIEPDNVQALVAYGAAAFNNGDDAAAKTSWERAIELDPDNVEAHYDLGFLYYSSTPQDIDAVRVEWGKVVELAPGTEIAETVKAHLDALESPAPSGSTAPASPAPSPAASAATASDPPASPAPSGAPAGSSAP